MGLSYHYFELLFILLFIFSAGVATKGKQKGEGQTQLLSLWQNHQHGQPRNLAKGTKDRKSSKARNFFEEKKIFLHRRKIPRTKSLYTCQRRKDNKDGR